jgi:hypothetical protein
MRPTADHTAPDAALKEISPHLDHALCQLRPRDRTAVALRFLENRSMADVGVALGLSPNATQKVVARALEKLRRMLAGRGVMLSSTAVLSTAMLESAAHAAPAAILGQIVPVALAPPAAAAAVATSAGAGAATVATSHLLADGAVRATIAAAKLRMIVTLVSVAAVVTGVAGGAAAIMSARRTPPPPVVVAPATAPDAAVVDDGAIVWHAYGQPLHEYAKPYPTLDPLMSKLIYDGRAADVAALLDEAPWLIEARTPRQQGGLTPLLVAARAGNVEIVNLLIRRGAYVEAENLWIGYTAINDAAYRGDPAVVKALLDVGADTNHRARRGLTALGLYYYALDRGLGSVTPEEGARTEQMLIAAGSIYPQQRLKDRQEAAAKRLAATQNATATTTSPASTRPTTAKPDLGPVQRNQRGPEPSPRANASDGMLPGGGSLAATFQANKSRVVFEPPASAAPTVRLFYTDREFVHWPEQDLLVARFRLLREPDLAATLGVTSEQMRRLTSLAPPPPRGMLASPADVAELQRLWSAHRAAADPRKATTSRQIAEALARIAEAARERTQAAYMTRAREVEAILTPQQIEAYREMRVETP